MKKGEVKISIGGYLRDVLDDFPEEITGRAGMPAETHLFKVRSGEGQVFLDEPPARALYHYVAQLLFTSTRCRKDIQTAVALLTTPVKACDEDDWKKLRRLLPYVKCTIRMTLILSTYNLNTIKWWVDVSYASHDDMRGHTGAMMSLGFGSVLRISQKKKLNTKRSTEAELIGADDALPQMLWTKYLIEAQRYGIDENIMYRDSLSSMLLETNGKKSSTKKKKHIKVRYFFIKDWVATGDVELKHFSTTYMLAYLFTKPLKEEQFWIFRAELMNIPEDTDITYMGWNGTKTYTGVSWKLHGELNPACLQECVGGYVKGRSIPDVSASGVLHTHSPAKKISGTGSPILDQITLAKPGKKIVLPIS